LSKQKIDMHQEKMYALVEEWSISGLSKKVFSERAGIGYNTFFVLGPKMEQGESKKAMKTTLKHFFHSRRILHQVCKMAY
jgi:hypothetical protein